MYSILGYSLIALQLLFLIPLYIHVIRTKTGVGQSLSSEGIWVIAGAGWAVYGSLTGSTTLIISGSIAAVGSGIFMKLLWSLIPEQRRNAIRLMVITFISVGASLIWGANGLAVSLSIFGVVQFLPQIKTSVALLKSGGDASGVSPMGSFIRILYTAGWAFYAGAWWVWGTKFSEVNFPLAFWSLAGVVAFSLQMFTYVKFRAKTSRKHPLKTDGETHVLETAMSIAPRTASTVT